MGRILSLSVGWLIILCLLAVIAGICFGLVIGMWPGFALDDPIDLGDVLALITSIILSLVLGYFISIRYSDSRQEKNYLIDLVLEIRPLVNQLGNSAMIAARTGISTELSNQATRESEALMRSLTTLRNFIYESQYNTINADIAWRAGLGFRNAAANALATNQPLPIDYLNKAQAAQDILEHELFRLVVAINNR